MARALPPELRHAVIKAYGSTDNAAHEACMRSDEISELWQTRYSWPQRDFWELFWKLALPVLGILPAASEPAGALSARSQRDVPLKGERKGKRATNPFSSRDFQLVLRMLGEGKDKREIARSTGISRQRVDRIENYWLAPGRDYEQQSGPIPGTVILRRV